MYYGSSQFSRALYDLEANINLKVLALFKQFGLKPTKPTSMWLLMVDRTMKKPCAFCLIFLIDFFIQDYEVDTKMIIILGR